MMPLRGRKYTSEEDAEIIRCYPTENTRELAKRLGRSFKSVSRRAFILKVKKTEEYHRWRILNWSDGSRFGQGRLYHPKPGFKAPRKQIGSIRRVSRGYLQVKTSTEYGGPKDWEYLHHIIWEKHKGKIPEGYLIGFIDGNPDNLDISNLGIISKDEQIKRLRSVYPELKEISSLMGVLTKEIRRLENGK